MQETMWARLRDSRPGLCACDSRNLSHIFSCILFLRAVGKIICKIFYIAGCCERAL